MSCLWTTPQGDRRRIDVGPPCSAGSEKARIKTRETGYVHGSLMRMQPFLRLSRGARTARKHFGAPCVAALLLCAIALGLVASAAVAASRVARCSGVKVRPTGANSTAIDNATLCLMNQVRTSHAMRPLRLNRALAQVAGGQASDMVRGDYFSDNSLSGQTPLARIMANGYSAHRLLTAQNIAWGTGPNATPVGIVRAWMESPPHRQIILTPAYRDVGVGVAPAVPSILGRGWLGATYAVEFGARR
jgi:hypothetical protein